MTITFDPTAVYSLLVCDAAVGNITLVNTSSHGLIDYLEAVYLLDTLFGVHLNKQSKPTTHSIDSVISSVKRVHNTLKMMVDDIAAHGKQPSQGPDGTPSSQTIRSVEMILEAVITLK